MFPHPLTNFEIEKYYQNKTKLNGVYARNDFGKFKSTTRWIAYNRRTSYDAIYFNRFGFKHILKEIKIS